MSVMNTSAIFCGGDRAEVVCPGWACQPIRPDIASRSSGLVSRRFSYLVRVSTQIHFVLVKVKQIPHAENTTGVHLPSYFSLCFYFLLAMVASCK